MNICIITVTFNDKSNLMRTFESIRLYKQKNHKYYVIDGGSNDGSIEEILNNLDIIDDFISEHDFGIYDAMNKALNFCNDDDDFLFWLNAGDELLDWSTINVEDFRNKECAFYAVLTKVSIADKPMLVMPKIKLPFNEKNFSISDFMHQGFLIKREIFKKIKYDTCVGLQAENLLMSICILKYSKFISDQPISVFYLDGISNTNFKDVKNSYFKIAKKLGYNMFKIHFFNFFSSIKYLIKIITPMKCIKQYRIINRRIKNI